jgi:predicted glycoside hydrolase/deacetylase ChbG (UPF0249 family)
MLLVNADDFGRSPEETDAIIACHGAARITSATAMVFMRDSERAAERAREVNLEVGLHLNLSQTFTRPGRDASLTRAHNEVVKFLTASKYAVLIYNPLLRAQFRDVIDAQLQEFSVLYGRLPTHVDGHQHMHLCSNVLFDRLLPEGIQVRRSFSFFPGEKNVLNLRYRRLIDRFIARRHRLTDFFFCLEQCLRADSLSRVFRLAETATVELMTHPVRSREFNYLMSDDLSEAVHRLGTWPRRSEASSPLSHGA